MIKKHENLRQTATPEGALASLTAKKAARTTTKNLAIFLKNTKKCMIVFKGGLALVI